MTSDPSTQESAAPRLIDKSSIANALGVSRQRVEQLLPRMPGPDFTHGDNGTPLWLPQTIEPWVADRRDRLARTRVGCDPYAEAPR